jgi:hypothetical protein
VTTGWVNQIIMHPVSYVPQTQFGEHIVFTLFPIIIIILRYFFVQECSQDQHETFQDDSLAFVDVPNDSHFF